MNPVNQNHIFLNKPSLSPLNTFAIIKISPVIIAVINNCFNPSGVIKASKFSLKNSPLFILGIYSFNSSIITFLLLRLKLYNILNLQNNFNLYPLYYQCFHHVFYLKNKGSNSLPLFSLVFYYFLLVLHLF